MRTKVIIGVVVAFVAIGVIASLTGSGEETPPASTAATSTPAATPSPTPTPSPTATPTAVATATPEPTPERTPTPTVAQCPTDAEAEWFSVLGGYLELIGVGTVGLSELMALASEDASIIFNPEWREPFDFAVALLDSGAAALEEHVAPTERTAAITPFLDGLAGQLSIAALYFTVGVDEVDADMIEAGAMAIAEAVAYTEEIQALTAGFCR